MKGICLNVRPCETAKRLIHLLHACILLAFLFPGCATLSDNQPVQGRNITLLEAIPFYPQEDYQCGPASLAGVLNYWGVAVSPREVAGEIFSPSAKGTLNFDMPLYVRSKGLEALQYSGSLVDLREKIRFSYPLIVLVDYGFSVYQLNHFMVVVGFYDEGVVVNSGKKEGQLISSQDFLKSWERTKYWTLLVKPKPGISPEKWLPKHQGIAARDFSGHPQCHR